MNNEINRKLHKNVLNQNAAQDDNLLFDLMKIN